MIDLISSLFRIAKARIAPDAHAHNGITGMPSSEQNTLAVLVMRQRHEQHALDQLQQRVNTLEDRIRDAMSEGREHEAEQLALALVEFENGRKGRAGLLKKLTARIEHMRSELAVSDEPTDDGEAEPDPEPPGASPMAMTTRNLLARLRTSLPG